VLDDAIMPAVDYRLPGGSPRSRSKTLSALSFFIRERWAWRSRFSMRSSTQMGIRTFLGMLTSAFFRNK